MTTVGLVATAAVIGLAMTTFGSVTATPQVSFAQVRSSTDVAWLEAIAGDEGTADRITPASFLAGDMRRTAYVRLGALRTPEALAAIARVESAASRVTLTPATVRLDKWPHAAPHVAGDTPQPLATIQAAGGTTVGVMIARLMGSTDLFLVKSAASGAWTRPKLINRRLLSGITDPVLSWRGPGELAFRFEYKASQPASIMSPATTPATGPAGPQEWPIVLADIERDRDTDGWTDIEETRLGLDPDRRDTDGDGIGDGDDSCPNYAPPGGEAGDEVATLLKKAMFATYGINRSRAAIHVRGESKAVQLFGFRGPVIYGVDTKLWQAQHLYGFVFVSWKPPSQTSDSAEVELSDYEAGLSAAGFSVKFAKVRGVWVIVEHRMVWIS